MTGYELIRLGCEPKTEQMAEMLQRRGPFEALSSSLSSLQLVILEINRGLDPFESLDTRRPPGLLMANGKSID